MKIDITDSVVALLKNLKLSIENKHLVLSYEWEEVSRVPIESLIQKEDWDGYWSVQRDWERALEAKHDACDCLWLCGCDFSMPTPKPCAGCGCTEELTRPNNWAIADYCEECIQTERYKL